MLVRLGVGAVAAVGTALLIGVPTGIVETSWYTRMTPVLWWNYPVWVASAVMTGALVATYVRPPQGHVPDQSGKTVGGGLLSLLAVGCPICNKLVVLALGVNGALAWFAPLQPVLALGSLLLLGYALRSRLGSIRSCSVQSVGEPQPR